MSALTEDDRHLPRLNELLWEYRSGMLRVEFLLEAQLAFVGTEQDQFLAVIADLMEETADWLRPLAAEKRIITEQAWGIAPDLGQMADWSPEPWATILRDHLDSCLDSLARVSRLLQQSRTTLAVVHDLTDELSRLASSGTRHGQSGSIPHLPDPDDGTRPEAR